MVKRVLLFICFVEILFLSPGKVISQPQEFLAKDIQTPLVLLRQLVAEVGEPGDQFGSSVGANGDTVVVGSPYDDDSGLNSGSAYVFERDHDGPENWGQARRLQSSSEANGYFGTSVAIDADILIVGAPGENSGSGAAYIFERNRGGQGNWGLAKRVLPDPEEDGYLGVAVAVHGTTAAIGGLGDVYIYEKNPGSNDWDLSKMVDGWEPFRFGSAVSIYSDTIVVGAPSCPSGKRA